MPLAVRAGGVAKLAVTVGVAGGGRFPFAGRFVIDGLSAGPPGQTDWRLTILSSACR
jgi:hypothetical protein